MAALESVLTKAVQILMTAISLALLATLLATTPVKAADLSTIMDKTKSILSKLGQHTKLGQHSGEALPAQAPSPIDASQAGQLLNVTQVLNGSFMKLGGGLSALLPSRVGSAAPIQFPDLRKYANSEPNYFVYDGQPLPGSIQTMHQTTLIPAEVPKFEIHCGGPSSVCTKDYKKLGQTLGQRIAH